MSPSPIDAALLRLEPPFFSTKALGAAGLKASNLSVSSFADDSIAVLVNDALRSSIEQAFCAGMY